MNKKLIILATIIILIIPEIASAALNTSLLHYFKFDENGAGASDSINSTNAIATGNETFISGIKVNNSWNFLKTKTFNGNFYPQVNGQNISFCWWANYTSFPAANPEIWDNFNANTGMAWVGAAGLGNGSTNFQLGNGAATDNYYSPANWIGIDGWTYYCWTLNSTLQGISFYKNGTLIGTSTRGAATTYSNTNQLKLAINPYNRFNATYDEFGAWNRTLGAAEITTLYNSGTGCSYPFTTCGGGTPDTQSITITTPINNTILFWTNYQDSNLNAAININNFTTSNSTIEISINTTGSYTAVYSATNTTPNNWSVTAASYNTNGAAGTYRINASARNTTGSISTTDYTYFILYNNTPAISITNTNTNRSLNASYSGNYTPISSGVTDKNYTTKILNSDGSTNLTLNISSTTNLTNIDLWNNLTAGSYKLIVYINDSKGTTTNNTKDFNLTRDSSLNISAKFGINNIPLINFTINITDMVTGATETYTTTSNTTQPYIIRNRNYTIIISSPGYVTSNITNISFTNQTNTYNFSLYTENSVLIYIYDENTLALINGTNISITFNNNITAPTYTTSNGTYYKDGLIDGPYSIIFYSANYTYRTYSIYVNNGSFQTLNAYLISNAYASVFTIRDSLTLAPLEGATFQAERLINSSYSVVESKTSDISGAVQIGYIPGINYRFTITKSGYTSKVFNLNPIIFSSYDIALDKTSSLNNTLDYGLVSILYYPKIFYNNQQNSLIIQFISPAGALISYAASINAPGGSNSSTGSNAIGETFILRINITNATLTSRVNITYNYTSTSAGFKQFRTQYEIFGSGIQGNNTIANIRNSEYGMGFFERILLVMIALVLIAGTTYMLAGAGGSIISSLVVLGVSVYLGFIPLWATIITSVAGIIILVAVSIGGNK